MQSKRTPASNMALGGIMAALAVIIMSMGTLIPVATYVCPMLCCMILQFVLKLCGTRVAWAWFGAVSVLSILMAPDKEAAAVFACIGYYPIIKPRLDKMKLKWLWKIMLFNAAILTMYWILLKVMGMDQIGQEFSDLGKIMTAALLIMGNVIFVLLDKVLGKKFLK